MKNVSMPTVPDRQQSNGLSLPRWIAPILGLFVWLVAIPLGHGVLPWAISLLTPRYGWVTGHPGGWNLLGLVPVVVGIALLIWIMVLGLAHTSELPERVGLDWTPKFLLRRGPCSFSRNPMYVAELGLWLGWAIFFGSAAVLGGFIVLCVVVNFVVRREERDLAAQFPEVCLEYKRTVPRWLGKTQRWTRSIDLLLMPQQLCTGASVTAQELGLTLNNFHSRPPGSRQEAVNDLLLSV
jgi:protein-S-isoprenylcysteine O-methyltransferase Ste14